LEEKPVWGIQIHPEIGISSAHKLLRNLIDQNPVNMAIFRKVIESKPRDSKLIYPIVRAFLKPRKSP
jgi:hypothetical protein